MFTDLLQHKTVQSHLVNERLLVRLRRRRRRAERLAKAVS